MWQPSQESEEPKTISSEGWAVRNFQIKYFKPKQSSVLVSKAKNWTENHRKDQNLYSRNAEAVQRASSFCLPNKNRVGVAHGDGTNLEVVYTVERLSDERSLLGNRLLWARLSAPHSQCCAWHFRLVPLERDRLNRPLSWAPISLIDSQKSTARYKSISFAPNPLINILRRASGTQWMSLWGATQTSCMCSWCFEDFYVPVARRRLPGAERERERERERMGRG